MKPKDIHNHDQSVAAIKQLAHLMGVLYAGLIEEGVPEEVATQICLSYIHIVGNYRSYDVDSV